MGSNIAWKLDADVDVSTSQYIIESANSHQAFAQSKDFDRFMWRRWSGETKWWAPDFVMDISKNIDAIFRLDARGDDNFVCFFYKGQMLDESEIWERPSFPSRPLFKKKLDEAKVKRAQREIANREAKIVAERNRMQQELESLKDKQKKIEQKLAAG